jgi:hypothetical protein
MYRDSGHSDPTGGAIWVDAISAMGVVELALVDEHPPTSLGVARSCRCLTPEGVTYRGTVVTSVAQSDQAGGVSPGGA